MHVSGFWHIYAKTPRGIMATEELRKKIKGKYVGKEKGRKKS